MDGSLRTLRGALVPKIFMNSYLQGGQIIKDTDECLGPKNIYEFLPMGWMDHQGHWWVPWSQKITSPTYEVDGLSRTPIGALVSKNLWSPTYRVDEFSRTPTGALVPKNLPKSCCWHPFLQLAFNLTWRVKG